MPKQINLILNGKGGVGKSFFATNFVQFLKDQKLRQFAEQIESVRKLILPA